MSAEAGAPSGEWTLSGLRVSAFSLLLLIDFILVAVMLATDQNLQTDFGSLHSVPPYYAHWYGLLAEGVLDLLGAFVLLFFVARPLMKGTATRMHRRLVLGALAWSILAIVAMLAIVTSYSMVGFQTANQFAQYLFQTTAYPYTKPYIPWLYDLLLVAYILTAVVGAFAVMRVRSTRTAAASN